MFYVKTSEKPGKIRQVLPPRCSKNKAKVTKKEDEVLLGQFGAELKGSRRQGWSRGCLYGAHAAPGAAHTRSVHTLPTALPPTFAPASAGTLHCNNFLNLKQFLKYIDLHMIGFDLEIWGFGSS